MPGDKIFNSDFFLHAYWVCKHTFLQDVDYLKDTEHFKNVEHLTDVVFKAQTIFSDLPNWYFIMCSSFSCSMLYIRGCSNWKCSLFNKERNVPLKFEELLEPRQFKNNLTMFESKLILKVPPFFTHSVGNFKMSLLSNIVRLFLNCLG